MILFDSLDYKKYINNWLINKPKRGHGLLKKMADEMGVTSVALTQIFKGDRELTPEQAYDLCDYLHFNEMEKEYFMLLVQYARAGNHRYKNAIEKKLITIREKSTNLKERMPAEKILSDEARAIFYSSWQYSGVRLTSVLSGVGDLEEIAQKLNLSKQVVKRILDFLIANGLLVEDGKGFRSGAKSTHLGKDNPLVLQHHRNWRVKAIEKMDHSTEKDLFYTCPMNLSAQTMEDVRKLIVHSISQIDELVDPSPSEVVACLNIDWFGFSFGAGK